MPWESSRRRKDPKGWAAIRREVIARAQGQCEHITPLDLPHPPFRFDPLDPSPKKTPPTLTPPPTSRCPYLGRDVDHIVNLAEGGTDTPTNLQLLCEWHHKQKTQAEAKKNRKPRTERHPGERHPGLIN